MIAAPPMADSLPVANANLQQRDHQHHYHQDPQGPAEGESQGPEGQTDQRLLGDPQRPADDHAVRGQLASAEQSTGRPRRRSPRQRDGASPDPAALKGFPPPTADSERLVAENLGLARKVAWGYAKSSSLPYEDLEAIAFIGLIKGCRKFDPAKGWTISTCCYPWIHGEILHHFRDRAFAIRFPMRWREVWGKAKALLADPLITPEEVAEQVGMSTEELAEMCSAMTSTSELNDDIQGSCEADIELDLLAPLVPLIERAFANLNPGDQTMVKQWWESPRRKPFPEHSIQQFQGRIRSLLEGVRLQEYRQGKLQIKVQEKPVEKPARRPRSRSLKQLQKDVLQLGLVELLGA